MEVAPLTSNLERLAAAVADRYRIERELGQGGMATVYLAEDLKHKRRVALKVLKPELAAVLGAERFVQEITTTAALQHPHILPLFDSGTADGFLFYVMPFIDGETLRATLDRETQLGVDEAVRIARDVADALQYAHSQGVIHRDIKPENILLANGRPMVADFGIALALSAAAGGRMTETGLSLGTPHYMSPEQATAEKDITARSDIYSLASVLYEMLAGQPPHLGGSAQQIIMKIIAEPVEPVTRYRKSVPANVAAAVAQGLEKLPADRFASAAAFAAALDDRSFARAGAVTTVDAARSWRRWLSDPRSWAALATIGAVAVVALISRTRSLPAAPAPDVIRATITGPVDSSLLSMLPQDRNGFGAPVVAPDGRHVAFGLLKSSGPTVYVRALNSTEFLEIPGERPFFSVDGATVGILRDVEVWTLSLGDRVPTRVGAIPELSWDLSSAVWHPDGRILVTGSRGVWALPARGGDAKLILAADLSAGEHFDDTGLLPDGRVLLTVTSGPGQHLEVLSPDATKRIPIVPGAERGWFVDDVLVFSRSGQRRAARFDLRRLEIVGEPVAVPEIPAQRLARSIAWVDSTDVGSLAPVWVSRDGRVTPIGLPPNSYQWPRISPAGGAMVAGMRAGSTGARIHVIELGHRTAVRLGGYTEPVWSADGRRVFMSTGNRPLGGLVEQVADASRGLDTLLALAKGDAYPTSVSRDGAWLAYYGATLGSGTEGDATDPNDLMFLDLRTRESRRVRLPGGQRGARFSPDGRWVAYQSTESGRGEVHIRPWPAMDANYLVSSGGGTEPVWAANGRELFYRHQNEVMAMAVLVRDGAIERAPVRLLFSGAFGHDQNGDQSWDIAPDGRFLMLRPQAGGRVSVQVALNWITEVRARLNRAAP